MAGRSPVVSVWDRNREAFAQAGPTISYSTAEDRMIVDSSVPEAGGSRRMLRAARPIDTPACGMSARPSQLRVLAGDLQSAQPENAPMYFPRMRRKK